MHKSAVESLAKKRHPFQSSTVTLGTPVLKIIFDQVDPDLIKWIDGTEFDQIGPKTPKPSRQKDMTNNQIFGELK
jgi:hypothetical protein